MGIDLILTANANPVTVSGGSSFDYYISPTGSDSNAGTLASPWAITALRDKTATIAGKRIGLLNGTYSLYAYATGGDAGGMDITATNLTVEAVDARQAIITTNNGSGAYPQTTSPALHLIGSGMTWRNVRFAQFSWNVINLNTTDVLIEGCDFYDVDRTRMGGEDNTGFIFSGHDPYANGSARVTIRNCRFERGRNGPNVTNDNNSLIGPLYRTEDWTIEYCSFYDCGHAIGWKNGNRGGLTVRGCYFHTNILLPVAYGVGSDTTLGNPHIVENCIFNSPSYHIGEWDPGVFDGSSRKSAITKIRNCTFLTQSNANGIAAISHEDSTTALSQYNQSDCYNNIFYRRSGTNPLIYFYAGATPAQRFGVIDYNLYPPSGTVGRQSGVNYDLSAWRTYLNNAAVTGQEANSIQAVPTFVNVSGSTPSDFQLQAGSAGKNAGRVGGVVGGAATDMGAWGYCVATGAAMTQIGCNFL